LIRTPADELSLLSGNRQLLETKSNARELLSKFSAKKNAFRIYGDSDPRYLLKNQGLSALEEAHPRE